MSALPPRADIPAPRVQVAFGPTTDLSCVVPDRASVGLRLGRKLGAHLGASQINLHCRHCSSVVSSVQQAGRIKRQWPENALWLPGHPAVGDGPSFRGALAQYLGSSMKGCDMREVSQFDCGRSLSGKLRRGRGFAASKRNATDLVSCSNV
jgi:hypothetical protein